MLIEMSIKGLMVDPVTNMPIVLLRDADNQRVLPIWVGPVEANAIALQVENVAPPRPMTHDLLRNLLVELGATLERVVISDLRESTFFAYLELHRDGAVIFVDARPSDALALSHPDANAGLRGHQGPGSVAVGGGHRASRRTRNGSSAGSKVWIRTISATRCRGVCLTAPKGTPRMGRSPQGVPPRITWLSQSPTRKAALARRRRRSTSPRLSPFERRRPS